MSMFHKIAHNTRSALRFLQLGIEDFDTTASLVPSSSYLVSAMLEPVPLHKTRCVVELGPGTGVLTQDILERLGPDAHVHGIELDESLLKATVERLHDPRFRPIHGSAEFISELIEPECRGRVDAIISSLGMAIMEAPIRDAITASVCQALAPDGVYTQYCYLHGRWFVYSFDRKVVYRWQPRPYFERRFASVESQFVPVNIPPAVVYACKLPRPAMRNNSSENK